MPKISKRRQPHCQQAPRNSSAILSQARKVSFEESSSCASHSSSCHSLKSSHSTSSFGALIPRTSPCSNMLDLMSGMLERTPTPTAPLCEMGNDEGVSHAVSHEEEQESTSSCPSPWGQFVDVIPHDDEGGCYTPFNYEPSSTTLHSSPAYHPYFCPTRKIKTTTTTGLPSIPNKTSKTQKLQQRRVLMEVEDALKDLRF